MVRARGLEAVVPVGQHEWRRRHRGADRVSGRGVVEAEALVAHAVAVGGDGDGIAGDVEQLGQPRRERESPDGVEVGARGAQQLEAIALRLRQRALMLAGVGDSSHARKHAAELLESAERRA